MHRVWKVLVSLLVILLLGVFIFGEPKTQQLPYVVCVGGESYVVDREAGTITGGGQVCQFSIEGSKVTITYPDGAVYFQKNSQMGGVGVSSASGWNDRYERGERVSGETLLAALSQETPDASQNESGGRLLLGLLLIGIGAWNAASPRTAWMASYGWRYKNAEPSDTALEIGRILGVIAAVIGVFCLL